MPPYRVGVDIGGTFTDLVAIDEKTRDVYEVKVPTTPKDPLNGVLNAINRLKMVYNIEITDFSQLIHGTTIATNTIIEKKGAKCGLITTKGFRDVIEIGRQTRSKLYDIFVDRPEPLIPRHLRVEISERVLYNGEIFKGIDEKEVERKVEYLVKNGVQSIAVCLLHSYINPEHEKIVEKIIKKLYPDIFVSLSSDVVPEFREYERFSTTVLNAYVLPRVKKYLDSFEEFLVSKGARCPLHVVQQSGGIVRSEFVKNKPVVIVESGPAAGVIMAQHIGKLAGFSDIISLDIGGTTAKAATIIGGMPEVTTELYVAEGYPLKIPSIDLVEVGAGGGSIAWLDVAGALKVGPISAGADPGPACYCKGGTEPTLTDAHVVLGHINPNYFLGGRMKISVEEAKKAVKDKLAAKLQMDLIEVAEGIIDVAMATVSRAIRKVTLRRGHDPRDFAIVAFGGAGPMEAAMLAEELGIRNIVIPPSPGLASALGMLFADMRYEYVLTRVMRIKNADVNLINETYSSLENKGISELKKEVVNFETVILRSMDLRYVGQSYEINIPVPPGEVSGEDLENIAAKFHEKHQMIYGHSAPEEPVELVNLRVTVIGKAAKPKLKELPKEKKSSDTALKGTRKVYFKKYKDFVECPIYERSKLAYDSEVSGPAIIEEMSSTIVIPPDYTARVDKYGNIIISR